MKKFFSFFIIFTLFFNNFLVFSIESFKENYLYYLDANNNWKIDKLEIEFNKNLTWSLNLNKIFFYSNTWWLSTSKLDSVVWSSIISNYYLSWNILWLNLIEQNNYLTGLIINNTTTSHLRIKTNSWVWIKSIDNQEIKFLYTTSFDSYKNVSYKEIIQKNNEEQENNEEILDEENQIEDEEIWSWEILEEIIDEENETSSGNILEQVENSTWEILEENTNSWEILQEENNIFPYQIKLLFQSPSYLLEKNQTEVLNYNCDSSKTDCKVNFNLNIDEWSWFKSISTSKYICEWDFWFSEFEEEKSRCNPNTIVYPIWNFETKFKVTQKSTWKFFQKSFFVKNEWFKESLIPTKIVYVWWSSLVSNTNIIQPINISIPEIVIQSGLDENWNCKKQDCSINLIYNQNNSKLACLWDFSGWIFNIWDDKKCNPGYVKYWLWEFKITLKVYEIWNENNFKENYLYFSNKKIEQKKDEKTKENSPTDNEEIAENYKVLDKDEILKNYTLKITKVSPNPIWAENLEFIEIENFWNEKIDLKNCSLDDIIPGWSKAFIFKETFILKPNQKQKFYKFDTKININNSGKEEVNLSCKEILIDNFSWNFSIPEWFILSKDLDLENIKTLKKQKNKNIYEINYLSWDKKIVSFDESFDAIDDLMKKDLSSKEKKQKFFELVEKSFYQKVSKQKSWVKIYGTTIPNVKMIFKLDEKKDEEFSFLNLFYQKSFASNKIYETKSNKSWNYEFYIKNPNIWEFEIKTFLDFWEDNLYELSKKSSLEIDSDYLEYISSSKNSTKQEKSYIIPKSIITLQWKLASNKIFEDNKLVCLWISECSVNLDWSQSLGEKLKYFWNFGNGKTFDKKNPASYKFGVWKHIISLKITDGKNEDTSYFIVEVIPKEKKEKKVSSNPIITPKVNAYEETKVQNNFPIKYHLIYASLLFWVFLLLSFLILRKRNII